MHKKRVCFRRLFEAVMYERVCAGLKIRIAVGLRKAFFNCVLYTDDKIDEFTWLISTLFKILCFIVNKLDYYTYNCWLISTFKKTKEKIIPVIIEYYFCTRV